MVEALVSLVSLFIGLVASTLTGYLFKRLRQLEQEAEQREKAELKERDDKIGGLNETISKLTYRLSELEKQAARVPALEQQVDTLCKELVDVRGRLQKAEESAASARDENGILRAANEKLTKDYDAAQREIHDLKTAQGVYDRVLALIGMERSAVKAEPGPQPGESADPIKVEEPKS